MGAYDKTAKAPRPSVTPPIVGAAERASVAPGFRLGAYVVLRRIASGGYGDVYAAEHELLRRPVAIKVLHGGLSDTPEVVERFVREAQAVNLIRHPNVVDIFEFGRLDDGRPYQVMELLAGQGLDLLVASRGRFTAAELLPIVEPICLALQAAHDCGVIHRDLKPSNIVLDLRPHPPVVKLVDFGIAKLVERDPGAATLTRVGAKIGTPVAMSPEQIRGETVDARADIYGLGVVLFHALAGVYPFRAPTVEQVEVQHLRDPPPLLSTLASVPPAVEELILRCLAKDREQRPASPAAVAEAFAKALRPRAEASPRRTVVASAVFVRVREEAPGCAEDDDALDDLGAMLDLVESELEPHGFTFPMRTSLSVLAVRTLESDADAAVGRTQTEAQAAALARRLASRAGAHPGLTPYVTAFVGQAVERRAARGAELVAGDALRPEAWEGDVPVPAITARP